MFRVHPLIKSKRRYLANKNLSLARFGPTPSLSIKIMTRRLHSIKGEFATIFPFTTFEFNHAQHLIHRRILIKGESPILYNVDVSYV